MASNLRVDQILPTVGTNVAIGTATGTVTLAGTTSGTFSGNLTSGSLSGITSVSTTNLTVNGNNYPSDGPISGARNRIINGDMRIDQRNAGAAVTQTTALLYPVDRFVTNGSVTSKFSAQRSTTAPDGFTNSLLITSLSAYSPGASEYFLFRQVIEGYNISDLGFGSANAKPITLSFWVRSSLTGTFGGSLLGGQTYVFSYTISAADTWEYKTITIPGSTSGTWATDNTAGLYVDFSMGAGSSLLTSPGSWSGTANRGPTGQTNVVGTNGATFYITGVQLEAGSVATPFERRSYGQEMALCHRYYWRTSAIADSFVPTTSDSRPRMSTSLPVEMRIAPTAVATSWSLFTTTTFMTGYYSSTSNTTLPAITCNAEL